MGGNLMPVCTLSSVRVNRGRGMPVRGDSDSDSADASPRPSPGAPANPKAPDLGLSLAGPRAGAPGPSRAESMA
jgi:hypothetical protein